MGAIQEGKILSTAIGGVGGPGPQGFPGAGGDGPQGASGAAGAYTIVTPDYDPPAPQYKDADTFYIVPGRYHALGPRIMGQYIDPDNQTKWDLSSALEVDPLGTYSAGSSSGTVGGLVASSCYSLWMLGNDANSFMLLPFVRPAAVDYNSTNPGKTTITNLYNHTDWDTTEGGFLTADDQWNNFRLGCAMPAMTAILKLSSPLSIQSIGTIEDCSNNTDVIILDGDQTEWLRPSFWYFLCPPATTPCLYLGSFFITGTSKIKQFYRVGWILRWARAQKFNIMNSTTTFGNSQFSSGAPPHAGRIWFCTAINAGAASGTGMVIAGSLEDTPDADAPHIHSLSSEDPVQLGWMYNVDSNNIHEHSFPFEYASVYPGHIRNQCCQHTNGVKYTIGGGGTQAAMAVIGFEE